MRSIRYNSGIFVIVLTIFFSCKSSQTAQTTQPEEMDEEPMVIRSSDIILVDKELKDTLEKYFKLFASMDLNDIEQRDQKMQEVFSYFKSPDTPVYFALYNNEGEKYYDKPTTISTYLNYIRDTQQAPHYIQTLKLDDSQRKILKIELAVK